MSGSWNEKLLVYRLTTKHDPDAFAALYDIYVKRIYRFVYFKVSSHEVAEDIVSDVFLRAWNHIITHTGDEINSFSGLLYRIARNAVIDHYRSRATQSEVPMSEDTEYGDSGQWLKDIGNHIDNDKLITAIHKLKQEYQEVLLMRYVDELELEEIAEITKKKNLAVRVTLHRALKKLKEIMEQ